MFVNVIQSGLREVHRSVRTQEAKVVFVAPNIEPSPVRLTFSLSLSCCYGSEDLGWNLVTVALRY